MESEALQLLKDMVKVHDEHHNNLVFVLKNT